MPGSKAQSRNCSTGFCLCARSFPPLTAQQHSKLLYGVGSRHHQTQHFGHHGAVYGSQTNRQITLSTHQTHWLLCAAMALILVSTLPPYTSTCPCLMCRADRGMASSQLYLCSRFSLICNEKPQQLSADRHTLSICYDLPAFDSVRQGDSK